MIILRNKLFGKFDKQLAQKQGISVEALRANRSGFEGTGTVHDSINRRMTESKRYIFLDPAAAEADAKAKGYNNAESKLANKHLLEEYKESKASRRGDPTKGYKRFRNTIENQADHINTADMQRTRNLQQKRIANNNLHAVNVAERNRVAEETKKKIQEQQAKAAEGARKKALIQVKPKAVAPRVVNPSKELATGNRFKNANKAGLGKRVTNLVKANRKTAAAIGAGTLLAGGIMAGRKLKKSNESNENTY